MTADVIDIDELNSGKRREGIFGAIYWWMVKVGFAIAGALSGIIIGVVGFNPELATTDQQGAVNGLHAFFCFFPAIGTIFAMLIMKSYDVTEERANEIREELDRRKSDTTPDLESKYLEGKSQSLVPNDLKGRAKTDLDFSGKSKTQLGELYVDSLKKGLYGLCFSPYAEGQDIGDVLSEKQIKNRMEVISPYTKWVRSFSCTEGNEFIPASARAKGLKTMVGAWIGHDKDENEQEIQALIQQAKQGNVDIAVVGNEVLLRGELTVEEIIDYIKIVKEALPDIPVGYVDAYYQFTQHEELVAACDLILVNCYPFWEGCHIDQSILYLQHMYEAAKRVSNKKPVIITETGWPSEGDAVGDAVASQENAIKYFVNFQNWMNKEKIESFYFSSFDESWKVHHEGDVGQRWGIWDKNEKLKNI